MATANYGWTTPTLGSANNVPADLLSLASQVDTTVKSLMARLPHAMAAGSFTAGQKTATYTHTVTFPAGRFSQPPIVTASISNAAGGAQRLQLVVGDVTAGTAEIIFLVVPGGTWDGGLWCTATWAAVQMTAGSAAG